VEPDPSGAPAAPDRQCPQEIAIAIDKLKRGRGLRCQPADWIVDEVDRRQERNPDGPYGGAQAKQNWGPTQDLAERDPMP
jgi:hypothetical protein